MKILQVFYIIQLKYNNINKEKIMEKLQLQFN